MKKIKFSFVPKWKEKITEQLNAVRGKTAENVSGGEMHALPRKFRLHSLGIQKRTVVLCAAALLLVLAAAAFWQTRVMHHYKVLSRADRADDSATQYVRLKGRILKCNPNGVTCVNDSNEVLWNVTFTMQSPITDVCGSTAVVADCRGKDIYVFGRDGQTGHFEVEATLLKIKVASQGVVAAVMEDGEITWTNVYDSQGTVIVKNKTSMKESGYPLDMDISSDGKKMVVSYLDMDNNNIKTRVVFYNFSSAGQSKDDYVVNSEEYPGIVVPKTVFFNDDYAAAVRDNGITFFSGSRVPEKKSEVSIETEMISVFYNDKYIGLVTASDEEEQTHKYKMQIYSAGGSRRGSCYFDFEYTDVALHEDEIVMHNNNEIVVYGTSGKKLAEVEYEKQVLDVMKTGNFYKYEIITPDSTDRIRLK